MCILWVFLFLFFPLLVMLPSEIPKLPTDQLVRGFPCVWKLLHDSVPNPFVSLFVFYILSYLLSIENGLPFWVPGVLRQHPEVVLWKLLSIHMIF